MSYLDELIDKQTVVSSDYESWRKSLPENLQEESPDYDLKGAYEAGMNPELAEDGTYHLGSRDPKTGRILKSENHPSFKMAIEEDEKQGYKAYKGPDGKVYTLNTTPPDGYTPYRQAPSYEPGTPIYETWLKGAEKPKEPDPKKLQNNMRVASIAQALGILADSFAAGQGAYVKERNTSAVQPVAERNRKLREVYEQKLDQYNRAGLNAMLQDAANKESWKQREYLKKQADADKKEQREYENTEWDRRNDITDKQYTDRLDQQAKKELYVATNRPRTEKKEEMPASKKAEIAKTFRTIPLDFIAQYTTIPTRRVKKPHPMLPSQTIEEEEQIYPDKLDYDIMLQIILDYDAQNQQPERTPDQQPRYESPFKPNNNSNDPLGLGI